MKYGILVLSLFVLAACAKSTDEVDNFGNCTGKTIDSYNAIVHKSDAFLSTRNMADAKEIVTACNSFKNLIGSQTCKASEGGSETTISYEKVRSSCESIASSVEYYELMLARKAGADEPKKDSSPKKGAPQRKIKK